MDAAAYQSLRDSQDAHWWFVGRRRIVARLIERFVSLPRKPRILEAGCGYGGNLAMLGGYGEIHAFEFDADARAHASTLSSKPIAFGCLPDDIGFESEGFDLIAMLDVLEHVDDDVGSLSALRERLVDGGSLLLTVPAVPWLWSEHDVIHHHKRRYTKALLRKRLREAGLELVELSYFNSLLFPLALAQRVVSRLTGRHVDNNDIPPRRLNALLTAIFASEANILGRIPFPIGLSLFAVARKVSA